MHELSIAQNIVETVERNVPEKDWKNISYIRLKVGEVAGVVNESLEFSYQAITAERPLKNSKLAIESIPFRISCNKCGKTTSNEGGFSVCSECGNSDTMIVSGSELMITEIEINEPEGMPG
jgi:hydrogenase nickel incorporation protein HypA/HybF